MKLNAAALAVLLFGPLTSNQLFAAASAASMVSNEVQIPVLGVFAPAKGYDDNDAIQFVVDGLLPNACWKIGKTETVFNKATNEVQITQLASKQNNEACNDESKLPEDLKKPVSFMAEPTMGSLNPGTYKMIFQSMTGPQKKSFTVEKAKTNNIDNLYYAITTDVYVADEVSATEPTFKVMYLGVLNSPCTDLDENVKIMALNDVFVILPQVKRLEGNCLPVARQFTREVNIKTPPPGRYLVQVRSVNGKSVNYLFTVKN